MFPQSHFIAVSEYYSRCVTWFMIPWLCFCWFFFLDIGFEVPDAFLVGYALDYNEYFRDLSVSLTTSAVSSLKIYVYKYGKQLPCHCSFSFAHSAERKNKCFHYKVYFNHIWVSINLKQHTLSHNIFKIGFSIRCVKWGNSTWRYLGSNGRLIDSVIPTLGCSLWLPGERCLLQIELYRRHDIILH